MIKIKVVITLHNRNPTKLTVATQEIIKLIHNFHGNKVKL